jgi:hypothetical protein
MSNRKQDVEMLLRLYGSDAKGWRGGKLEATCPFARWTHSKGGDSHPSFAVLERSHGHYSYKCLACGEAGPLHKMVWRMAELGSAVPPHASILAYGWDGGEVERVKPPVARLDYAAGGKFAAGGPLVHKQDDWRTTAVGVQGRLLPDVMYRPRVADAVNVPPDEEQMSRWVAAPIPTYAIKRGFADVHKAWGLGNNEAERRWVHPIRAVGGALVGYTARLYWDKPHCYRCGALRVGGEWVCGQCNTNFAKYKHHAGPWRRTSLFGIDRHVEGEPIVITEGTTDALNLWRHGVRHPVAILGASLSAGQAQLIAQRTSTVYAMGDGDDAGRKMADEVCRTLGALGCNVQIVGLPDGRDPGDLTAAEVGEFFAGSGETPLTSDRNMVSNELFTAL